MLAAADDKVERMTLKPGARSHLCSIPASVLLGACSVKQGDGQREAAVDTAVLGACIRLADAACIYPEVIGEPSAMRAQLSSPVPKSLA